jgi:hypothetical protein
VKDEHIVGKDMARNGHKMAIYHLLFFRELASAEMEIFAFCVITFEPNKI